jgi:hypothetical protein
MASKHLTLRIDADSLARLDEQSARTGQNRSELARTLIEEGLRMARHPGIVFRDGPAGRRPGLAAGPDIWEVARVIRGQEGSLDDAVRASVELTGQPESKLRVAALYYREFSVEIDAWLDGLDRDADEAYGQWLNRRDRVSA